MVSGVACAPHVVPKHPEPPPLAFHQMLLPSTTVASIPSPGSFSRDKVLRSVLRSAHGRLHHLR